VTPATWPRPDPSEERLLLVDPAAGAHHDGHVRDLVRLLQPGDLLVVNDAATLPASLAARGPEGERLEVRLTGERESGRWQAVLFGAGDWRTRTEDRPAPPALAPGVVLRFDGELSARVDAVSPRFARLMDLRFDREGDALWTALYAAGRPVQYSYLRGPVPLDRMQTPFGARPWAAELPSAGRPLEMGLLLALRRHGVGVARLTHAASLSATGDDALDAALPLPERYELPVETVAAVTRTRVRGARVVAAGTTVVRALEGSAEANGGVPRPGPGVTDLRIGEGFRPRVVDGLLSGLHEPGSSHHRLLTAFAPGDLLDAAWRHATDAGYLGHEFGDSCLILRGLAAVRTPSSPGS
jgi:S-adenosylmethionine:tRNA ribosyltransferase-isomerase